MRTAPFTFLGWQDGEGIVADFELWNIQVAEGVASVTRATAEKMGYALPPAPCLSPSQARAHRHAFAASRRSMTAQPFVHA